MHIDTQLLALLSGHFIGDFILQSDELVKKKGQFPGWLLWHAFVVSATTWLFLGNWNAWWAAGVVLCIHFIIDWIKLLVTGKKTTQTIATAGEKNEMTREVSKDNLSCFIGDQFLHILSIVILWLFTRKANMDEFMANYWLNFLGIQYTKILFILMAMAVSTRAISVVLQYQMARFAEGLKEKVKQGLPKGGETIGMLERILVFIFVLAGKPEGVGFVVAAKSVFRIGELTGQQDKEHAEYIMIGTLRSFTYALIIAFITKWIIENLK